MKKTAWAVTNLSGKNLVWGSPREMTERWPVFSSKKSAVAEKKKLDELKPSPNVEKFERKVVPITIIF